MDRMHLNFAAFREPRGVMRVLQLVFAIFAFSTTTGFDGNVNVQVPCQPSQPATGVIKYGYPFLLDGQKVKISCPAEQPNNQTVVGTVALNGNLSSDAEFFVATGVLSLLYCLAIIGAYAFFEDLYHSDAKFPMADFFFTVVLAILWISSSGAWANGLSYVKYVTDPINISEQCKNVFGRTCSVTSGSYSSLNISVMLGFLNFFLWASDLWFLYKETPWFDNRQGGIAPA